MALVGVETLYGIMVGRPYSIQDKVRLHWPAKDRLGCGRPSRWAESYKRLKDALWIQFLISLGGWMYVTLGLRCFLRNQS